MDSIKILVIEDNPEVRENTAELLELSNYQVKTAQNGKEGVKLAREFTPDLILCDVMMPELDGYGVLHMLSKDPATAIIPFIFVTAKTEKTDIRKGMNLGADDYLTKPFDETDLLDAIEIRLKKTAFLRNTNEAENVESFLQNAKGLGELDELSNDRKSRIYTKKEALYREGDFANYLYFLTSGKVKTIKSDDYGKDLVTKVYTSGEFIGYFDLMEGEEYTESAIAMEKTEVLIIPKRDFVLLLERNHQVAMKFIQMLSNQVKENEERLLQLAFSPVRERTASALLHLKNKFGQEKNIKISREDLASLVGTATESVIRTLSDFKEEKLISMQGRDIVLENEMELKRLAGV